MGATPSGGVWTLQALATGKSLVTRGLMARRNPTTRLWCSNEKVFGDSRGIPGNAIGVRLSGCFYDHYRMLRFAFMRQSGATLFFGNHVPLQCVWLLDAARDVHEAAVLVVVGFDEEGVVDAEAGLKV